MYKDILFIGDNNSFGGKCYFNMEKKICILHIPKCGTQTMKRNFKEGFSFRDLLDVLNNESGIEYAAMIRHPLGRWISGFATNLANIVQNKRAPFEMIMEMLDDKGSLEYIFKTIAFEVHTKPQYLFLAPFFFSRPKLLFCADNRQPFYDWLKSNGVDAQDEKLHHVNKFPKEEPHYIFFKKLEQIVYSDPDKIKAINNFYQEDIYLYEQSKSNN